MSSIPDNVIQINIEPQEDIERDFPELWRTIEFYFPHLHPADKLTIACLVTQICPGCYSTTDIGCTCLRDDENNNAKSNSNRKTYKQI